MALDLNDKSGNSNTLTAFNTPSDVTSSLPFIWSTHAAGLASASEQCFSAADSTSLSFTGTFTLELWVKFTTDQDSSLIAKDDFGTDNTQRSYHLYYLVGDHTLHLDFWNAPTSANNTSYSWAFTPSTGTWYHIAVTANPTGSNGAKCEWFKNGVSQGNGTASSDVAADVHDSTIQLDLGRRRSDGFGNLDGVMDEVRIWNVIRTGTQIANSYKGLLTIPSTGLVAYYPFEPLPITTTNYLQSYRNFRLSP